MQLFLLRHGIAEDRHVGGKDFDRALTAEGRAQLARVARGLRRLKVAPAAILSSPLVRARQTAEIVAPVLGQEVEIVDRLAAGVSFEQMLRIVEDRDDAGSLMLVGHEPDFSTAAALLVGAPEDALVLKKAGLIRVDFHGPPAVGSGQLRWLLAPSQLALIGDAP
jgi:phosphohistidine phosphatase